MIPADKRTRAWQKKVLPVLFAAVALAMACAPALAQPVPPSGGGAGHFTQGIPVYWPYHALLMITGLILIAAGVIVARSRATGTWYKTHRLLEILSGACIIAGLVIGVYMVALSGLPHLRNIHEVLGAAIGALLIITIAFGFSVKRARRSKNAIRTGHRWLGRITLALVVLNILLGILFLSIILRR